MKFFVKIFVFCLLLCSCSGEERHAHRIEKTLATQQQKAEQQTEELVHHLEGSTAAVDTIWALTHRDEQILFYVFSNDRLLYWSSNQWTVEDAFPIVPNRWVYARWSNVSVMERWTYVAQYKILTVIPIKYEYPITSRHLHNGFVPPFDGDEACTLSLAKRGDAHTVHSADGEYAFSVTCRKELPDSLAAGETIDAGKTDSPVSFSYQQLLESEMKGGSFYLTQTLARSRIYYIVLLTLLGVLVVIGIWNLVRRRGFNNLRLRAKFLYVMLALIVATFAYIIMMSVRYVGRNYSEMQQQHLQEKCRYIASALQSLYYWDLRLDEGYTQGLNVDLRDLCYTYEVDIHVYDLRGRLIGSSSPSIFGNCLISSLISPKPFFLEKEPMTQLEFIGDMPYLAAYAPLYNGAMLPIGYVSVPSFISLDNMHEEVDQFMARLLPPCILLLLVAILTAYVLAHRMTAPLSGVSESLRQFRLGDHHRHIDYMGHDEVGELVQRYNEMVDQLEESSALLARSERESAWRTMARQIAHEINNPLTPMRLRVQQLQRLHQEEDPRFERYFKETASMLVQQIDDLSRIASSFSAFAKMPEVHTSEVDIAQRLSAVIYLMRSNEENIPIRYVGADCGVMAMADSEQVSEVFTNIIKNAIQALQDTPNGDIIVLLQENEDEVCVRISDNGPGIDESVQDKVFLPNFTTKSTGTGLGLAICKNIVEGSGGRILFETSKKGTIFLVYFKKKQ